MPPTSQPQAFTFVVPQNSPTYPDCVVQWAVDCKQRVEWGCRCLAVRAIHINVSTSIAKTLQQDWKKEISFGNFAFLCLFAFLCSTWVDLFNFSFLTFRKLHSVTSSPCCSLSHPCIVHEWFRSFWTNLLFGSSIMSCLRVITSLCATSFRSFVMWKLHKLCKGK